MTLFNLPPPPAAVSQLLNAHNPKDQSLPITQSINVCISLGLKGMKQSSRPLPFFQTLLSFGSSNSRAGEKIVLFSLPLSPRPGASAQGLGTIELEIQRRNMTILGLFGEMGRQSGKQHDVLL